MAITTYDSLIAAFNTRNDFNISKASVANQLAGGNTSLWRATGQPAAGAAPTATASTCVSTLLGSLGTITVATGLSAYISNVGINGSISNTFYIYDRVMHNGGLAANTTGLTSIVGFDVSGISDRNILANYSNLEWFAELYADVGTTGGVLTMNYDSPTATGQTTTVTIGGTSPANRQGRLFQFLPVAGHPIKLVNSVRLTTSTGTAGSYGLVCGVKLTQINMGQPNVGVNLDFAQVSFPLVPNNACLWMTCLDSSTASGIINGYVTIVKG